MSLAQALNVTEATCRLQISVKTICGMSHTLNVPLFVGIPICRLYQKGAGIE